MTEHNALKLDPMSMGRINSIFILCKQMTWPPFLLEDYVVNFMFWPLTQVCIYECFSFLSVSRFSSWGGGGWYLRQICSICTTVCRFAVLMFEVTSKGGAKFELVGSAIEA